MLEYLKVLLAAPVLYSAVAILFILLFKAEVKGLISRIATIKVGSAEVTTSQGKVLADEEKKSATEPKMVDTETIVGLPAGLTETQRGTVEQLIRSHIATAYLWEYRYLNFFLVRMTQMVLDWLVTLQQPTTVALYDAAWLPGIQDPRERRAIIDALKAHHLIQLDDSGLITVTPKGREYQQWRGALS